MNNKKYFLLFSCIALAFFSNVAIAANTPSSGAVHCWGTRVDTCFDDTDDAESWAICAPGEYLRGVGIAGDGDTIERISARCHRLPNIDTFVQSCESLDGAVLCDTVSYNNTASPNNMEDWAACPSGWLLKGIGFKTNGSTIDRAIAKCLNPLNNSTRINNTTCNGSCGVNPVVDVETYVECVAPSAVLSAVGFSAGGTGQIERAFHICVNLPSPSSTPTPLSTNGTIQGITTVFGDGSINVPTTITVSGIGQFTTTLLDNTYSFSLPPGTYTVSVNTPVGYTNPRYNLCIDDVGLCHMDGRPTSFGNSVSVTVVGGEAHWVDLWWFFDSMGILASPSPAIPIPTIPPPVVNITGPSNPFNGQLNANGLVNVPLRWSFSDALGGSQNAYRIRIQDQERPESALVDVDNCGTHSPNFYTRYCMNGVNDFQTDSGTGIDNFNNEIQIGSSKTRIVQLEKNRNYRWRVGARSSNGNRWGWSSSQYFTVGVSSVASTPSPIPSPASIDLMVDGSNYSQINPLDKVAGDLVQFDWVGSSLISCIAQKTFPEDSDSNWWDRDFNGDGIFVLPTTGAYNMLLPNMTTSDPLFRLLKYMILCTADGIGFNFGDSVFVRVINPPIAKLRAEPSLIKPNQMSQLIWSCENSTNASIDYGIMSNSSCEPFCSGTENVYPSDSTTYTLTCTNGKAGIDITRAKSVTVQIGTTCEGNVPCPNN